jgi:hypothetical protein
LFIATEIYADQHPTDSKGEDVTHRQLFHMDFKKETEMEVLMLPRRLNRRPDILNKVCKTSDYLIIG